MAVRARKSILSALWPRGIVAQGTYIASKPIRNNDAFGRPFFFVPHCRVVVAAAAAARTVVRVRIIYLDERKTPFFFFLLSARTLLSGDDPSPHRFLSRYFICSHGRPGEFARGTGVFRQSNCALLRRYAVGDASGTRRAPAQRSIPARTSNLSSTEQRKYVVLLNGARARLL